MATASSDLVPDGDPVVDRLRGDLDQLEEALTMLEYHGHALAAVLVRKEIQNTKGLIGKWQAVHRGRLPLTFGQRDLWNV